jgi:hypothetical protein
MPGTKVCAPWHLAKPALNSTSAPTTMADRIRHSDDRARGYRPRFARRREGRKGRPPGLQDCRSVA